MSKDGGDPESTGWILSVDKHTDPLDPFYKTLRNTTIQIVYPDLADNTTYTVEQVNNYSDYIMTKINDFETALFSPSFQDPLTGYLSHIDVDSFVDYFIHTEMTTSVDAYRFSVYFHKESCTRAPNDCKLKMGPAWDYDLSLGTLFPWMNARRGKETPLTPKRRPTRFECASLHVAVHMS